MQHRKCHVLGLGAAVSNGGLQAWLLLQAWLPLGLEHLPGGDEA